MHRFLPLFAALVCVCLFGTVSLAAVPTISTTASFGGSPPPGTKRIGFGSAFFVDDAGDLVTAEHVVGSCRLVRIAAPGLNATEAVVTAFDHSHDLALLHVEINHFGELGLRHFPPFDRSAAEGVLLLSDPEAAPKLGFLSRTDGSLQDVGYPGLASASPVFLPMIPLGVAVAANHDWRIFLQGGAIAGQSGSPVMDRGGRVVGMFSQAVLRPGYKPVAIRGVGEAWDAGLAVPSPIITTFLNSHSVHTTDAASSVLVQQQSIVKVFCFM